MDFPQCDNLGDLKLRTVRALKTVTYHLPVESAHDVSGQHEESLQKAEKEKKKETVNIYHIKCSVSRKATLNQLLTHIACPHLISSHIFSFKSHLSHHKLTPLTPQFISHTPRPPRLVLHLLISSLSLSLSGLILSQLIQHSALNSISLFSSYLISEPIPQLSSEMATEKSELLTEPNSQLSLFALKHTFALLRSVAVVYLLHVDAGLGTGFQEFNPIVNGKLCDEE